MIVSFDLTGILCLIIIPPIIVFLCRFAYDFAKDIRPLQQNKYVIKLIDENNKVWKKYIELQREFMDLQDEKDDVE